jgi:carboxypeptidase Taq
MGFDYTHGRLDLSTHPFTTDFGLDDVRITTRVRRNEPANCIFSCIHECGHAMYQQGISPKYAGTPLADGASLAFHESQSRFWENILGRSPQFWRNFYPGLVETFPDVPLDAFLKAVNRVRPSFIRTESDEVTYNLHIILRVELERALIEDRLSVDDLPAAWNDAFERSFGIRPSSDREGVLQDVHWYSGGVGYFPTYMLGNLIGAELRETLFSAGLPDTPREALAVLRDAVYRFGAKYAPSDFLRRLTGHSVPGTAAFLRYLRTKHLGEAI